jgi:hypothetical protein
MINDPDWDDEAGAKPKVVITARAVRTPST